jgi:dTMP kinase
MKLVCVEGIDGCGKTTLIHKLNELGYEIFTEIPKVVSVGDPDALGVYIRNRLQAGEVASDAFRVEMALLFTKHREQYQQRLLRDLCATNVVMDRGMLSTMVYGHTRDDIICDDIASRNLATRTPDLTIYLAVDCQTALNRLRARGGGDEVYKRGDTMSTNLEYFQVYVSKYKHRLNIHTIDATQDEHAVLYDAMSLIETSS